MKLVRQSNLISRIQDDVIPVTAHPAAHNDIGAMRISISMQHPPVFRSTLAVYFERR